ncbi:DUF1289 domain-containing protein [Candidatus Berkiella aquae]|uniref:DUF1289 domain-containing protein n=1 Tax=Candidatus Berkiella aquae TaxID=295108 RepID=A0AAE3HZD2_9GAMM|nr:DUF1289 domain-containing protein [Candidatus Berkiella aquae]
MKLKSPCIDACRIDTRTHWCTGCGRTSVAENDSQPATICAG